MDTEIHSASISEDEQEKSTQFTYQHPPYSLTQVDYIRIAAYWQQRQGIRRFTKYANIYIIGMAICVFLACTFTSLLELFDLVLQISVQHISNGAPLFHSGPGTFFALFMLLYFLICLRCGLINRRQKKANLKIYNQTAMVDGMNFRIDKTGLTSWNVSGSYSVCVWSDINDLFAYQDKFILILHNTRFVWLSAKEENALAFIREQIAHSRQAKQDE